MVTLVADAVSAVELTVPTGTPLSSTSNPGRAPRRRGTRVVSVVGLWSGLPEEVHHPVGDQREADDEEHDQVDDEAAGDHRLAPALCGEQVKAGELLTSPRPGMPHTMMFS